MKGLKERIKEHLDAVKGKRCIIIVNWRPGMAPLRYTLPSAELTSVATGSDNIQVDATPNSYALG